VRDVARDGGVEAWLTLPRRIYLDTLTLQTMYDYGETLWEDEPFEPLPGDRQVPGLIDEIDACATSSSSTNGRTSTSLVTEATLREVAARNEPVYRQWVDDVLDSCLVSSEGEEPVPTVDLR
jgi:hypothetical protein